MKSVLAFGTFDLLHPGHVSFLEQAKELGGRLIVVVAHDKSSEKIKGIMPVNSQKQRIHLVSALKAVDLAIAGKNTGFLKIIEKIKPEIIALGYDQKVKEAELRKQLKALGLNPKIIRCKPFKAHKFKSSKIRKKILEKFK